MPVIGSAGGGVKSVTAILVQASNTTISYTTPANCVARISCGSIAGSTTARRYMNNAGYLTVGTASAGQMMPGVGGGTLTFGPGETCQYGTGSWGAIKGYRENY